MDDRYKQKLENIQTKIGMLRINRNCMAFGSLSCVLIQLYVSENMTITTSDDKIFVTSSIIVGVVSSLKAIRNQYEMNRLEEECQKMQSEYYKEKILINQTNKQ